MEDQEIQALREKYGITPQAQQKPNVQATLDEFDQLVKPNSIINNPRQPQTTLEKIDPLVNLAQAGIGAAKGVASTIASVPKAVGEVGQALYEAGPQKQSAESQKTLSDSSYSLQKYIKEKNIQPSDPRYEKYQSIIKSNQDLAKEIQGEEEAGRAGIDVMASAQETFKPANTAQSIGFYGEKLAEFMTPSKLVTGVNKAVNAGVSGSNLVKNADKIILAAKEAGVAIPQGARLTKALSELTKVGLHTVPEATSAYLVSRAQGADHDEALSNAKWAGAISGTIGTVSLGASQAGESFKNAARKLYQSALKPSMAKGAPPAKDIVETGLKEGIRLSNYGLERTAQTIDALEESLGKVIDDAANATQPLVPRVAQTVDNHMKSAGQVYDSFTKGTRASKETVQSLFERAKTNIVDQLVKYGEKTAAGKVKGIDVSKYSSLDDLKNAITSSIQKGGTIKTSSLKSYIDSAKDVLGETVDVGGSQKAVETIDDMFNSFVRKYGDDIPVEIAQKLKTNTYQVLKNSYGELANGTREGMKQLVRGLKEGIVEVAPQAGEINGRLKALYQFDEALTRASTRVKNADLLGLGTKILASSDNKIVQIASAVNQFLGAPVSKSGGAVYLYKIGNLLKGLSAGEATEFASSQTGKKILERLTGKTLTELAPEERALAKQITAYLDDPSIGLSIKEIKKIPFDDMTQMSDITDYVAGSYKPGSKEAQKLELDATRLWEKYLPDKKMPKSLQGVANEFARQLEMRGF